jgi:hypothetical protein
MLHKLKSSYGGIAKYFPELGRRLSSPERNKQLLAEMAGNGDPRPTQKTRIGRMLSEYTKPSSVMYDAKFHKKMKKLRPDWFWSQTEVANQKKKELLRMAKNGEKRPSYEKTKLGQALSNYTRKSSPAYDAVFDKTIRKLRPDWFDMHRLRALQGRDVA